MDAREKKGSEKRAMMAWGRSGGTRREIQEDTLWISKEKQDAR